MSRLVARERSNVPERQKLLVSATAVRALRAACRSRSRGERSPDGSTHRHARGGFGGGSGSSLRSTSAATMVAGSSPHSGQGTLPVNAAWTVVFV